MLFCNLAWTAGFTTLYNSHIHNFQGYIQIAHGFPDPKFDNMPRHCQILREVKIVAGLQGHSICICLPNTPSVLQKMKQIWVGGEEDFDKVMLWAAATTTYLFYLLPCWGNYYSRRKTYDPHVNLSYEDISVDNSHDPSIISLLIKQSKIDQAREGVKVYMGKTDDNTCPVKVLLHFLRLRGSKAGPLFDKMAQYYRSHNLPKL